MKQRVSRKGRATGCLLPLLTLAILLPVMAVFTWLPGLLFLSGDIYSPGDGSLLEQLRGQRVNIVLLGFDRSAAREQTQSLFRPDTIMVASLDLRQGRVHPVSIPRDSYVPIHGTETWDKINHAYAHGYRRAKEGVDPHRAGLQNTINTVGDFLGDLPIHGYIMIDMDGAAAVVDAFGGVQYHVEEEVRTRSNGGRLLLEEGDQLLDGRQFMDYIRNRAGHQGGERGRTERQQQIMIAFFSQLKNIRSITGLPAFIMALAQNVETDLSLVRALALACFSLRVDPAEIEINVFRGEGRLSYRDGRNIWYLVIDEKARVEMIEKIFGIQVEERPQVSLPGPSRSEDTEPDPDPADDPDPAPPEEPEPEPELEPPAEPVPDEVVDEEEEEVEPGEEEPLDDEPPDEEPAPGEDPEEEDEDGENSALDG